jgi:hypothetical protein
VPLTIRSGVNNSLNGVGSDFGDCLGEFWQLSKSRSNRPRSRNGSTPACSHRTPSARSARRGGDNCARQGIWTSRCSRASSWTNGSGCSSAGRAFNVLNHANLRAPGVSVRALAWSHQQRVVPADITGRAETDFLTWSEPRASVSALEPHSRTHLGSIASLIDAIVQYSDGGT